MEKRLVVVGGGFAGVWAALGAARRLAEEVELQRRYLGVAASGH